MSEGLDIDLDLGSYFQRIGWTGHREPNLGLLQDIQSRHLSAIAFEGLDPFLGRAVSIDRRSIWDKLVHSRRGGYCYEHNGLMLDVLTSLGFQASALGARVVWMRPSLDAPRTHQFTLVTIDDAHYIVDVGFGPQLPPTPVRLVHAEEQRTHNGTFRVLLLKDGNRLEVASADGWMPLYHFTMELPAHADFEMANWFMSTHPRTLFTRNLIVSHIAEGRRASLLNKDLTVRHADGRQAQRRITDAVDLRRVLEDEMLLSLPVAAKEIWVKLPDHAVPAWP